MMISLMMAVVLVSVTSDQKMQQSYAQAYAQSVAQNKPLMVVVGAPWCPACNVLKDSTLKQMAQTGELDEVSLVVVNRDEQPELARKLTKGEQMIPQIILYTHDEDNGNWQRRKLLGFQSKQPIRSLIRRAIGRVRG
jgi:thioredoxin-like negative regulator of GroEL